MIDKIASNIQGLAVDVELLTPLENNARLGNVDAIVASYNKFGQVKPIVAVENETGGFTVIAGNHQLEAAKRLGWDKIAVSVVDLSNEDALAFALADNRIAELGTNDTDLLYKMLTEVLHDDEDFFDQLGWDDFSVAAIENTVISSSLNDAVDPNGGWSAPEIVVNDATGSFSPEPLPATSSESTSDTALEPQTSASRPSSADIVVQGSTVTGQSGSSNASIQFTLVFDSAEHQSRWYSFLKWLQEDPAYDGDTTSERLLDFIGQHSPKG